MKFKKSFFITLIILFIFLFSIIIFLESGSIERRNLLYKTDFSKLLEAGREVLNEANLNVEPLENTFVAVPDKVKIPKVIRRFSLFGYPRILINKQGYLRVQVEKNRDNAFGVDIYPEDFNYPYPDYFDYGNKELLPGLWYWDQRYGWDPNYDKIIDKVIEKGRYPY